MPCHAINSRGKGEGKEKGEGEEGGGEEEGRGGRGERGETRKERRKRLGLDETRKGVAARTIPEG